MIDYEYALANKIVVLKEDDKNIQILSKDEITNDILHQLSGKFSKNIVITNDKKYNFEKYFEEYYCISQIDEAIKKEFNNLLNTNIENLFAYIMKKSNEFSSSDIHIIADEDTFVIKFRINSILRTFARINVDKGQSIIRIIKLKSNIEISKTITPLEGRFDYAEMSYRVSIIPTVFGEKITLRILGNVKNIYTFTDIGMSNDEQSLLMRKIEKSSGFIIVTGATGSGKSTTMFTMIHYLNDGTKNIVSIEDPVEYKINGVTQIQIEKERQIDFHNILKFVLRQDPQIINVGEIRDELTAKLAIQSANTGHLVFSTMHTNDSISSITRLKDLKVENYEISNALSLIISQRLIRTLCPYCKRKYTPNIKTLKYYDLDANATYYEKVGCPHCYHTGYDNQIAIFEMLDIDEDVKKLISNDELAINDINITTLKDKIKNLVQIGITSIEELSKYV